MKVFAFDPTTGKRGKQIGERKLNMWTAESLDYMVREGYVEPIDVVLPADRHDAEHMVHVNAGITLSNGEDVSYADPEQWVCFCYGKWGTPADGYRWKWIILPPSNAVKRTAKSGD